MELNDSESRAISSSPSTGMRRFKSSVRATCSTAMVSSSTGRRPVRATHRPAAPAADDADSGDEGEHEDQVVQGVVDFAEGAGDGDGERLLLQG